MKYEHRVVAVVVAAGAVPALVALPLLWSGDHDAKTEWTLTLFILLGVAALAGVAHARVVRPMQTVANLAAARAAIATRRRRPACRASSRGSTSW
jgi:hypothetical protein